MCVFAQCVYVSYVSRGVWVLNLFIKVFLYTFTHAMFIGMQNIYFEYLGMKHFQEYGCWLAETVVKLNF